jgi:hypothetical protein
MRLTGEQSYALLEKHDCYVTEACDKCGQILGPIPIHSARREWCVVLAGMS